MAFPTSTLASIIIGATAITGSAVAVTMSSAPSNTEVSKSVSQPLNTSTPQLNPEPTVPSATTPSNPNPLPTPLPILPPPTFNGDDDDNYEDEDEDDEDDWEHEDYEDDDEEWEDDEEEWED